MRTLSGCHNPHHADTLRRLVERQVCHAPAAFADVKLSSGAYLVKGKRLTSFTNEEEEQAKLTEAIPWL